MINEEEELCTSSVLTVCYWDGKVQSPSSPPKGRLSSTTFCALVSRKQSWKELMAENLHQKQTHLLKAIFRPGVGEKRGMRKEQADGVMLTQAGK